MRVAIEITKAYIFRPLNGMDKVTLQTDIADPIPMFSNLPLTLSFETPKGKAEEFLAGHFPGVGYSLVEAPKAGEYKFARGR